MKLHISIILLLVFLSGCGFRSPKEVSISQLIADYQENAVEASLKYNGQTLIFTATVSHFAQLEGIVGVYLENGRVICFVDKSSQPDVYSNLKRGEIRTFTGVVSKDTKIISLTNCEVK